eukprot:scaffold2125_cov126-Cylindrotheca_fusiformis.AAC.11
MMSRGRDWIFGVEGWTRKEDLDANYGRSLGETRNKYATYTSITRHYCCTPAVNSYIELGFFLHSDRSVLLLRNHHQRKVEADVVIRSMRFKAQLRVRFGK